MPLTNIVDGRRFHHQWKNIHHAVIEPTWHDNGVANADQAEKPDSNFCFDERFNISLTEAIAWANSFPFEVTLFLYNFGQVEEKVEEKYEGPGDGPHRLDKILGAF